MTTGVQVRPRVLIAAIVEVLIVILTDIDVTTISDTKRGKVEMNAAATTLHVADGSLVVIVSIPQKTVVLDQEAVHFN